MDKGRGRDVVGEKVRKDEQEDIDTICERLHDELSLGAEASTHATRRRVLVLLDFNGLLACRTDSRLPTRRPEFNVPTGKYKQFDKYFYIRPFARELVSCLLNDPRCEVAVYTSITAKNVMPVIRSFDEYYNKMTAEGKFEPISCGASTASGYIDSYSLSLSKNSIGLFDQRYNVPDPEGSNEWDTKRDLSLIWNAPWIKAQGFDRSNTLIIDAEARKVKDCKKNALVVPEYVEKEAIVAAIDYYTTYNMFIFHCKQCSNIVRML
eukprot:gene29479-36715_t